MGHPTPRRALPQLGVDGRRRLVGDVELEGHQSVGRSRHVTVRLDPVAIRFAEARDLDQDLVDAAVDLRVGVLVREPVTRRVRREGAGRQRRAVDHPVRIRQQPGDLRAHDIRRDGQRRAPVRLELIEARARRTELDGRRVLAQGPALAGASGVGAGPRTGRAFRTAAGRAVFTVVRPARAYGGLAGRIGAVNEPVAVVVDHVTAILGSGRDAALDGGGGRAGDRRGRRGDGRRGGDTQDVTLVADAVAVAAGGRAGVVVGVRAGRAVGHVREVAAPRLRVAGWRPGAGIGVVGAGLHHVVLVAAVGHAAPGGRAGVAVGVRAGPVVGPVREVAVPRLRVAGGRPGAGIGVVGAGLHHVVLVAAVGHAAPGGQRAVAARRRAGVVVRVRARRAVGHRGVAAHPGALVAHVLGALDVVVAVRAERDRARLLPRRREVVVAPGVVLGRQVAGGLLDLVR